MKGYYVASGYMGYVVSENRWILFASETDYKEYITRED